MSNARIIITVLENGEYVQKCILDLNDEQCAVVADWINDTADTVAGVPADGMTLWELPDDDLLPILTSDNNGFAFEAISQVLPDFHAAITERFGADFLMNVMASALNRAGLDGNAFAALPYDEQIDYARRLGGVVDQPTEH